MGISSSMEQISPEQREAEAAAAALGALPVLQKAFSKHANPETKAISIFSLQRCFSLTFDASMCEAAGVSEKFSELVNDIASSLVDLFFHHENERITWAQFVEGYVRCCGRVSSSTRLSNTLRLFASTASKAGFSSRLKLDCDENVKVNGSMLYTDLLWFLLVCWTMQKDFSCFKVYEGLPNLDNVLLSAVMSCCEDARNLNIYDCDISAMEFEFPVEKIQSWVMRTVPYLADCFVQFVHARLQNLLILEEGQQLLHAKQDITDSSKTQCDFLLTRGRAWAISLTLKNSPREEIFRVAFSDKFDAAPGNLLYRSSLHGKGLNRFWSSIEGYSAPVLILISGSMEVESEGGSITREWVVGAITQEGFENKDTYYGSSGYLYAISPVFCPFHPSGKEKNFVYSHLRPTGRVYDPSPKPVGIGFGGKVGNGRIFLDEDFMRIIIRHHAFDRTYDPGPLLPGQGFRPVEASVMEVEAWGLGGLAVKEGQKTYKEREQLFIEQRRKVDIGKLANWEDSPEKMMMNMVSDPGRVQRQER